MFINTSMSGGSTCMRSCSGIQLAFTGFDFWVGWSVGLAWLTYIRTDGRTTLLNGWVMCTYLSWIMWTIVTITFKNCVAKKWQWKFGLLQKQWFNMFTMGLLKKWCPFHSTGKTFFFQQWNLGKNSQWVFYYPKQKPSFKVYVVVRKKTHFSIMFVVITRTHLLNQWSLGITVRSASSSK